MKNFKEFENWYDKNYKKLLIIPAVVLSLALIYLIVFSISAGDIIHKDVSLTGGTTITFSTDFSKAVLEEELSKTFSDFEVKTISDNSGNQIQLSVTVKSENEDLLKESIEDVLNYKLTDENSSTELTSSSLSEDFYKQLIVAVLLAFFWMAAVVFTIFGKGKKLKLKVILANLLFGFFLGTYFLSINKVLSAIIFSAFAAILIYTYIKNSVPAFAVMLSAFADIVMTLAVVNLFSMQISSAGIVAFLMLIGYSVDTDILLTTRILQRKESINKSLFGAFKTGTTMTITSLIAVIAALIVVYSFNSVLNQIFTILIIGLFLDLFNTWITNASIIKWYAETKK